MNIIDSDPVWSQDKVKSRVIRWILWSRDPVRISWVLWIQDPVRIRLILEPPSKNNNEKSHQIQKEYPNLKTPGYSIF